MRLEDKIAVVIGGEDYLGRAISIRLAEEGAKVTIICMDKERIDEAIRTIQEAGQEVIAIAAEVTDKVQVQRSVSEILKAFARIDILVNALGKHKFELAEKIQEEMWDSEIDLNLKVSFLYIQSIIETMKKQKYGKIVNISSTAKDGVPWFSHRGHASYAAARSGIIGLTRALAYELGRYNININCVVSGPIEHPRSKKLFKSLEADPGVEVFPTKMMALQRFGKPEDVANAVLFLSSDESSYITGHSLYVSGGLYGE